MPKTLRITFSGICTRAPGYPREGQKQPDKVYVLMPASRRAGPTSDKEGQVAEHKAFIYVPAFHLKDDPPPFDTVDDEKLGMCYAYVVDRARIVIDPPPMNPLQYFMTALPLDDRPGSDDVAPEDDARWLPEMRDIVPGHHNLNAQSDPRNPQGDHIAAIVELAGGTIKSSFPCKTVQPQTFKPAINPMAPRVLATEFAIEMLYPDDTPSVSLKFSPLFKGVAFSGLETKELVLEWNLLDSINVRMGNDTEDEIRALGSVRRCDARVRSATGFIPRDNDFDLHYGLLNIPPNVVHPLPVNGSQQTLHNGCAGAGTGG